MPSLIADTDIGGARVRLGYSRGLERVKAGTHLTADQVLSIPIANRRALVDGGYIEIYPKGAPRTAKVVEDRFVIRCAGSTDKFDVIAGRKLNAQPLTRAEADRLKNGNSK